MAGCEPAHLPELIAIAEILVNPRSGAEHSGKTSGADALMIIDVPSSVDFGFDETDDVLAMPLMSSGAIIGSVCGSTPDEILPFLADGLARIGGWDLPHVYGLGTGQYRPLLVLVPPLPRTFADAGWTEDDVRTALFEHARIPAWRFEKLIREWSDLTSGRRTLVGLGGVPEVADRVADPRLRHQVGVGDASLACTGASPVRCRNAFPMILGGYRRRRSTPPRLQRQTSASGRSQWSDSSAPPISPRTRASACSRASPSATDRV